MINLQYLSLSQCELKSLVHLNMSCCLGITILPESLGHMINLQYLSLSQCNGIRGLPEATGNLINLRSLNVWGCENLESLPDGISKVTTLKSPTALCGQETGASPCVLAGVAVPPKTEPKPSSQLLALGPALHRRPLLLGRRCRRRRKSDLVR
jgi:hypothetical protein